MGVLKNGARSKTQRYDEDDNDDEDEHEDDDEGIPTWIVLGISTGTTAGNICRIQL